MNDKKTMTQVSLPRTKTIVQLVLSLGLLLAAAFGTPVHALTLTLKDQTTNATIPPPYKYIINVDNTGTTEQRSPTGGCSPSDTNYPGTQNAGGPKPCNWISIAGAASSAPIFTQGDQSDIGAVSLPAGRYLISVLADGYKLDGEHVVGNGSNTQAVTVNMHSGDLPPATIQSAVFEDISPTNGAPDVPAEHGLAGFRGHIYDYIDEVTTDIAGNPLCSTYAANGDAVPGTGGSCLSKCYVVDNGADIGTVAPVDAAGRCPVVPADLAPGDPTGIAMIGGGQVPATAVIEGKLKIPNLGPNRYALSITSPDSYNWQQTTTLEGNLDWDAWVMEGATGLDTEFVVAGEPFPAVIFGYVQKNVASLGGNGTIKGIVDAVKVYVPTTGGLALPGTIWGGLAGGKIDKPVDKPWIALTGLNVGDTSIWVGQGNADGSFNIPGVPAGNYTLTWWDSNLNYILDLVQVTVDPGETVDMGVLPLNGWWTRLEGYVYNDLNENGIKDPGEGGLANYPVVLRKRENSLMDRGAVAVTTDAVGHYVMENAYPMTQWLVEEAYDDLHYTTGITYQADNQNGPATLIGEGVDVSVLPIIGLSGRLDWGKHSYKPGTNGGIVGTVSYGTTRNELDPRYSAVENWQPGVSGLTVNLYQPVACGTNPGDPSAVPPVPAAPCDELGQFELETAGGAFKKATGGPLQTYVTETWQRPSGCVARGVDNEPIVHGPGGELVLPTDPAAECLEAPLMGVQFGPMADNPDPSLATNFGAAVDGNYGFGDLAVGDYLVEVEIPNDALGKPMYKVTREEDVNIANGDNFIPAVPPPACAGPLHTVDVAGMGTDGYTGVTVPDPSGNGGADITIPDASQSTTVNDTFVSIGGSTYEGQPKPSCGTKLVHVSNGKSIAPLFEVFTDVPLPGRFWGLIVDDLNFSSDPKAVNFGEKAGIPFAPIGIYDYTDRLVYTAESDFNGLWDVLLPSTNRISCPTPSGVCANLYRMVGNDPGVPGRLNLNYHPEFRTIATEFEAFPGLIVPADLAPTQVGVTVQLPGGQVARPLSCPLNTYAPASPTPTPADKLVPEFYAVSTPVVTRPNTNGVTSITIQGKNFGATKTGPANVYLDAVPATTTAWNDASITMTVRGPTAVNPTAIGPHKLTIIAANGQKTVDGLTFHVRGTGYNPTVREVGPGRTFAPVESLPVIADHAIQRAIDAGSANALVVVYPNTNTPGNPRQNPRGAYYENLIISRGVKLQGVGPGSPDGSVRGSIIDGGAFGGDSPVATDWQTKIDTLTWDGNQTVYDGAVISIYTPSNGSNAFPVTFNVNTAPSIDGFDLRGGDQQGFPGNINVIGGGPTGQPGGLITQGGAIFANAYARNLQITNNVIQNNGGAYGTIRIGTPDVGDNQNDNVRIVNNRIIANGGTNLAGGIGLFTGADNYEVASNDICGNFSAEYGGGISHFGLSPNGKIHHNRVYFNRSYDEGAGIMIAGQLPANPANLSPGAGNVDIYSNLIQGNLSNDDGGGIRFLQAAADCSNTSGLQPCAINVYNNMVVNNVSAHEGGGISLNDAPNVRIYNNTVMKNSTTATAATSTGSPAPAGVSTSLHSSQLNAALGNPAINWSNPLLFNNIFWDNRAGARSGSTVTGIGADGDASPINQWDLGAVDTSGPLAPTNSIVQLNNGGHLYTASATNSNSDPAVVTEYDTVLDFAAWRTNPAFIGAIMVTLDVSPTLLGNYHILAGSPAINLGAGNKSGVNAPALDIDDGIRTAPIDTGADELGAVGSGPGGGTPGGGGGGTPTLPVLTPLDNFNRGNASTLGTNWSQVTINNNLLCFLTGLGASRPCAPIRVNTNQASDVSLPGNGYWNGAGNNFGANQAAAFTFANTTLNNAALMLKASGGTNALTGLQANFIRVQYQTMGGGRVLVQTTTNGNALAPAYTTRATFTTGASFANGNTLSAVARADGTVAVFKTAGATTTLVGSVIIPTTGTGAWTQGASGGRIGMQLPNGARVDNFAGGTVP